MASSTDPVLAAAGNFYPSARAPTFNTFITKTLITCSGIRRTPGYLILTPERQPDTVPALGVSQYTDYRHPSTPSTINPNGFWTPYMLDSFNQLGGDNSILEQTLLYPNGTVTKTLHLEVTFKALLKLEAFPFDKHYMLATRRTRSQMVDRVKINVGAASFTLPPRSETFDIGAPKALVCPRKEVSGDFTTDCRLLCTNATCPGWQPGMAPMYVPPRGNCPPNPTCNATFPFPNCHLTCGETAALCQDVFVFYYPITRKGKYYLQNMLAPIILVTAMAASSYWNELSDYADRMTMMATALLSMMALQAYVSGMLPQTDTITFIHYALYTSYALMGFGLAFIISSSFLLKHDIKAAGRRAEDTRLWMLRGFYAEAMRIRRLIRQGLPHDKPEAFMFFHRMNDLWDKETHRTVHKEVEHVAGNKARGEEVLNSSHLPDQLGEVGTDVAADSAPPVPHKHKEMRHGGIWRCMRAATKAGLASVALDLDGDGRPEHVHPSQIITISHRGVSVSLFIPTMLTVRLMVVEFDNFMRVGHLLVFTVVLAARYFQLAGMDVPEPTCDTLLDSLIP